MNHILRLGVITGCLLLALSAAIGYVPAASSEPLASVMRATGANLEEYSINAWVKLPEDHYSDEQLQDVVMQVADQLAMDFKNDEIIHQQRNKNRIVKAEQIRSGDRVVVMAQSVPNQKSSAKEEAYLVVNIESLTNEGTSSVLLQEKIHTIIKKIGDSPRISTCLIGWLDGKLMDGELEGMLKSAFSAIDGTVVDQLQQEQYVSATGYSSAIHEYLQVGGKKININIAIRYSQYDNRTYVIVGSPIITREY
ncbi:YwmB family TATA-box binding protein [Pelosinus propionicus]|uniref:TATA-box binding n=1 Tax=Pelosinus propionicus DSM 13327 TaxID=1123291 RepID=A0A1I4J8L2_9FIRM|nr:YwmB family TATA-box binding protein [Pelosinus propionicus]SFL62557.1 TATA-box binding [Pelosinus propionicus DSM 13327]